MQIWLLLRIKKQRNPSHFGSYCHCAPRGNWVTDSAPMKFMVDFRLSNNQRLNAGAERRFLRTYVECLEIAPWSLAREAGAVSPMVVQGERLVVSSTARLP